MMEDLHAPCDHSKHSLTVTEPDVASARAPSSTEVNDITESRGHSRVVVDVSSSSAQYSALPLVGVVDGVVVVVGIDRCAAMVSTGRHIRKS
jgi:hypothetical protein